MKRTTDRLVPILFASVLTVVLAGCGRNLFDMVGSFWSLGCCGIVIVVLDIIALLEIAGSNKFSTGDKVIWALIIIFFPIIGFIAYYVFKRNK